MAHSLASSMSSVADSVKICMNLPGNKGRGLLTTKNFKKGDVLFGEEPLVSAQFLWNAMYRYAACDQCLRPLETAQDNCRRLTGNVSLDLPFPENCDIKKEEHVRCSHCQVVYCSAHCCQRAWDLHHQTLCMGTSDEDDQHPLNKLKDTWRNIHYPPETSSIMLLVRMIALVRQAKDKESMSSHLNVFCNATVNKEEEIVHKLLGEEFQEQLNILRSFFTDSLYEEYLQKWFTPDGFRSLFAMIGTNGQGIGTSSLSTWVSNCENMEMPEEKKEELDSFIDQLYEDIEKVTGEFINCEGSGLYLLQSACNHSCDPNAEVFFPDNNHNLAVKALKDINEGEEVFISYLDDCQRERSRHSRQKILSQNYLFICKCERCISQADELDVTSEEEMDDEDDV